MCPWLLLSRRTCRCGASFLGWDMIETSFGEERQVVSDDLKRGQRIHTGSNIRWSFWGWWVLAIPHLISECWKSVGSSTDHQGSPQKPSGVIPLREVGSQVIALRTLLASVYGSRTKMVISRRNYTHPHLMISVCDCLCLGPSGVGVNELRRQLIERNPNHFQSAVPRMFLFSFIAVHILVKFSLHLQVHWAYLVMSYYLCRENIRHGIDLRTSNYIYFNRGKWFTN